MIMIHDLHCDYEESQVRCDDVLVLVWGRSVVARSRQGAKSLD